jgi:hypothetical protein
MFVFHRPLRGKPALAMSETSSSQFSSKHRWSGWLNLALAMLAVLALAVLANYLSHRHHTRHRLVDHQAQELSTRTHEVLGQITNDVQVIIFYDQSEPVYREVKDMLAQYRERNPHLTVVSVDPDLNKREANKVKGRFQLPPKQGNAVIFAGNNKLQIVPHGRLSPAQQDPNNPTQFRRTHFHGERLFTSALLAVNAAAAPKVYWATGNGELPEASSGHSRFRQLLDEQHVSVSPFNLRGTDVKPIPDDCRLLIIAGPQASLDPATVSVVTDYLEGGGRVLITLHQDTRGNLNPLLNRWGVEVFEDSTVQDATNQLSDGTLALADFNDGQHEVVRALHQAELPVCLLQPTPMVLLENRIATQGLQLSHLVSTSGDAESYHNPGLNSKKLAAGRFCVAAAVQRGDEALQPSTRLVVIGDTDFLHNRLLDRDGNTELAQRSVNWLLGRQALLRGIGPRPLHEYRFEFKGNQFWKLAGLLVGVIPLGTLAFGMLIWFRRRT